VFLKILGIALGCAIKPVIAIPASVAAGAEFYQTIVGGIFGGCSGITIYLYSLDFLLKTYKKHLHNKKLQNHVETPVKKKPIFTKRNRMIVGLMQKYGLNGIAFLTPYGLDYLLKIYKKHLHKKKLQSHVETPIKKKPIFTKRNRMIVRLMQKYGLNGIAFLTPLLSLPLGVFIAERINEKFIQNRQKVLLYLCVSMVIWTFILTGISHLF
jgi:hypothetical protein